MTATRVIYSYSDRKNGWYCYLADAEGNQIGNAEYVFSKSGVLKVAKQLAGDLPVERG